MNPKYTSCPTCHRIYAISVTQLTIAQGLVNCPHCGDNFNALSHFVELYLSEATTSQPQLEQSTDAMASPDLTVNQLHIFNTKVKQSHLNLRAYLNNLSLNNHINEVDWNTLHQHDLMLSKPVQKSDWGYYALWGVINVVLVLLLLIQLSWFNPKMMQESSLLRFIFNEICQVLDCPPQTQKSKNILR